MVRTERFLCPELLFLHNVLLQQKKEHRIMNCNQDSRPVMTDRNMNLSMSRPAGQPMNQEMWSDRGRFPVGMGYVPMQNWETPYSMEMGYRHGTIFPSLDYPFVMGGCRYEHE